MRQLSDEDCYFASHQVWQTRVDYNRWLTFSIRHQTGYLRGFLFRVWVFKILFADKPGGGWTRSRKSKRNTDEERNLEKRKILKTNGGLHE